MRRVLTAGLILGCLAALVAGAPAGEARVETQVVGLLSTNSYLLYDSATRDAAIIDPGGPVDALLASISAHALRLRYILITHAHQDHVFGVPVVQAAHPRAALAMSTVEFEDGPGIYAHWETAFAAETAARIRSSPLSLELFNFDYARIGKPRVFLRDGQTLALGSLRITVISTPGHSRGGVCLRVGDRLFSGDTLFQGSSGTTAIKGSSRETLVASVRRLYALLPDRTVVLPAHRAQTDVGRERAAGTGLK